MRQSDICLLISALFTVHSHAAQAGTDPPSLWTKLSYAEAVEEAKENDRLLLVYATASWCPPCRQMERTTWRSEDLAQWVDEHGIAFKFDVDENRSLSRELDIEAMPTMIAFIGGEPFDRVVGYKTDQQLIEWLEDAREGKRSIDRLLATAGERVDEDGRVDVSARLEIARKLARGGALDAATEEYIWLWDNMLKHEPAMGGVRVSFMAADMERLAQRHEKALEAFRQRREQYWTRISAGTAGRDDMADWVALARVVGDEASLLTWFDWARDDPKGVKMLPYAGHRVEALLIENDRWADVALLYRDPVTEARRLIDVEQRMPGRERPGMDEAQRQEIRRADLQRHRRNFSQKYAVLLAAERDEEAEAIATMFLEWDDSTAARGALVTTALKAGQPREHHLQWLDEAEEMGARVRNTRRELNEALKQSARQDA